MRILARLAMVLVALCSCHGKFWCENTGLGGSGRKSAYCGGGSGFNPACAGTGFVTITEGPFCTVEWIGMGCGANGETMCNGAEVGESDLLCIEGGVSVDATTCEGLWQKCQALTGGAQGKRCSAPRSDTGVIGEVIVPAGQ